MRGVVRQIRSDSGCEFIAQALRRWLQLMGVGMRALNLGILFRSERYASNVFWLFIVKLGGRVVCSEKMSIVRKFDRFR